MPTVENIEFVGSGGNRLAGVLHRPDGSARGSVLLAHCFTCSKDLHTMTRLSRGLSEGGYAVLRFDFTGLGDSGGEFTESTLGRNVTDLTRAATTLIQMGFGPCAAIGHSLGGAALLLAGARIRTIRSFAVLAAPSSATHVRHLFEGFPDPEPGQAVNATIAGRSFPISREMLDDLDRHDVRSAVADLARPLLVVHPVDDSVVPVGEGERIFEWAAQPKAFVPLLRSDHLVADRDDAERLLAVTLDWFDATR